MYFVKRGCDIYHILSDALTGSALCGVMMSNLEVWKYQGGQSAEHVKKENPADKPLCKHCERRTGK